MTKTQLRKKFRSMKRDVNKGLDDRLEKAINSGAIDLQAYADDFILPRIVLTAALKEMAFQVGPFSPDYLREAENLGRFL